MGIQSPAPREVKIKAVLDTNVVISGIFWKGTPFEILKAWQEQRFHLVISGPILREYRRVLAEMASERTSPVQAGNRHLQRRFSARTRRSHGIHL